MSFIIFPGVITPPLTPGAVPYGTGSNVLMNTQGTAGQLLISGGGAAPTWSSTFPGVPPSPLTAGGVVYGTGTATAVSAAGTAGQVLTSNGAGAPSWSAVSGGSFISQGDSKVEVTDSGTGKVEITVDNVEVADFTTGAIVFNETGANQDFRVEGDTNANLLFVDASADAVGIKTNTPGAAFEVNGSIGLTNAAGALSSTGLPLFGSLPVSTSLSNGFTTNAIGNAIALSTTFGGSSIVLSVESTGANPSGIQIGGSVSTLGSGIQFVSAGAEAMRINNNAQLLVGTTTALSAGAKSTFSGSVTLGGVGVLAVQNAEAVAGDNSPPLTIVKAMTTTTSSARFVQFYANNGSTAMGGIVGNGATNVQFASISDRREKTNISALSESLNKIMLLNPVSFNWISNNERCPAGFIAQDIEKVFPEYVIENFSGEGEETRKGLTGGLTAGIIPHLVKALQELKNQLDIVSNELAEMKNIGKIS